MADPLFGMPYVLITRPDVKTVADLKGKSVGIARVGDLSDKLSRLVVRAFRAAAQRGRGPAADRRQPARALPGVCSPACVQGIVITPPLDAQARKDGLNVLYDLADLNLPFVYSAVHAGDRLIRDNPQLVQRFVAAMAESVLLHREATPTWPARR